MRALVLLGLLVLGLGVGHASASRSPTGGERTAIKRAVLLELERDSPTIQIRVAQIRVSSQSTGPLSPYSKIAVAHFTGVDEAGADVGGAYALLGHSRRFKAWVMLGYGSSDVGCLRNEAAWFGGRRPAVLADLGVPCSR